MLNISTDIKKRQKYFYAKQASELYDDTIGLVCPYYDVVQEMMFNLLSIHFKACNGTQWLLDIGAGTGAESIKIMKKYSDVNVVAIDFTEEMKDVYKQNYKNWIGDDEKRYIYLVEDFLSPKMSSDKLLSCIGSNVGSEHYSAIVTAYTIHHYELAEKREMYKKVYSLLGEGGVFMNIDLFDYKSKLMTRVAHQNEISWISGQFKNPDEKFDKAKNISEQDRGMLSKAWINHYNYDNILHPISSQVEILKEIGFSEVENPYRYYENGLIWARK
jgi:cyclopropane fatty-acyl-phospholipid synthase-like methyltransferase